MTVEITCRSTTRRYRVYKGGHEIGSIEETTMAGVTAISSVDYLTGMSRGHETREQAGEYLERLADERARLRGDAQYEARQVQAIGGVG